MACYELSSMLVGGRWTCMLVVQLAMLVVIYQFIWVLCSFQHCAGHITMGSFMGRGNQYIQLVKVLYCKLLPIGKQLPAFPHKVWGLNH